MSAACARCETALEAGDLRCAVCALPTPTVRATHDGPVRAKVLRCDDCGAVVAFAPSAGAPLCKFCGAVTHVEQPVDPIEVARVRVPFTVDRDVAEHALRAWLARRGWFAPATLASEAVLDGFAPLCWAAWRVNARARVAWAADSDAGARRSDWAPHAGECELAFDDLVIPATRGLTAAECRALIPHYDLASAVAIAPDIGPEHPEDAVADATIEAFDAQRSAARAQVARGIEQVAATRVERFIPGRRFRNVHVACLLEDQRTDRVALPAWVLAYRYRGVAYRAVVHGQHPEIVIGRSPIDWTKVMRLLSTVALALAAIVALVLLLTGCKGDAAPARADARDYTRRCTPDGSTFAPLTGRAAVQAITNFHVDAGGLIEADVSSEMLIVMDFDQQGTSLGVVATVCSIQIPDIPIPGQDKPMQFDLPYSTVASVGTVTGTATLDSADQTCAALASSPLSVVLGARLDPIATAPMPAVADDGTFTACLPDAIAKCANATGQNCACDQEGDGYPGSTIIAHNVPAVDISDVFMSVRTTFSLHGHVFSTDSIEGTIDATLEQGVLACRLQDGNLCGNQDMKAVRNLSPALTQQPDNPSTFRAVRVPPATTCADVIANESIFFPR